MKSHARVSHDGDTVVLTLPWWEAVLGLRRSIRIPRAAIRSVEVVDRTAPYVRGLRVGTAFPRRIGLGTFLSRDGRTFADVRRGGPGVVVELDPPARYRRIVLEPEDPAEIAAAFTGA